jgi:hypothetical protein
VKHIRTARLQSFNDETQNIASLPRAGISRWATTTPGGA